MVIEVSSLQALKALPPIVVTLFGMVTEVSSLQASKASHPIVVTLFGMVTVESKLSNCRNTITYYDLFNIIFAPWCSVVVV